MLIEQDDGLEARLMHDGDTGDPAALRLRFLSAAERILADDVDAGARFVEPDLAAVALRHPDGRAVLVAHLPSGDTPTGDALELLDDATRSLALAMEGEALEHARREAAALRRSHAIQRELLSSLSHELRTPLTAIQGFASTLLQPDLTWDAASTERFLRSIASEGARLERLVGDLLDSSAIESGILRLQRHWCDLALVVEAAVRVVEEGSTIHVHTDADLDAVWADHDRLEQVFVNLLENAAQHGSSDDAIDVSLRRGAAPGTVEVEVSDQRPRHPAVARRPDLPSAGARHDRRGRRRPGLVDRPGDRRGARGHPGVRTDCHGASFVVTLRCDPPSEASEGHLDASWNLVDATGEPDLVADAPKDLRGEITST